MKIEPKHTFVGILRHFLRESNKASSNNQMHVSSEHLFNELLIVSFVAEVRGELEIFDFSRVYVFDLRGAHKCIYGKPYFARKPKKINNQHHYLKEILDARKVCNDKKLKIKCKDALGGIHYLYTKVYNQEVMCKTFILS